MAHYQRARGARCAGAIDVTIEEFGHLCALTVSLTKLRQAECKHLAIENFAPKLLRKLMEEFNDFATPPGNPVLHEETYPVFSPPAGTGT